MKAISYQKCIILESSNFFGRSPIFTHNIMKNVGVIGLSQRPSLKARILLLKMPHSVAEVPKKNLTLGGNGKIAMFSLKKLYFY